MPTRERFLSNIGQIVKNIALRAEVNRRSNVVEDWSSGVMNLKLNSPMLPYLNTPFRSRGSKESSDPCGQSHGQCTPQRDAHCAHHHACTAHARRQPAQKRDTSDVPDTTGIRLVSGTKAAVKRGIAAPTAKLPTDASAA